MSVLMIAKRLFPDSISGDEELPPRSVPNGKREHPAEEPQAVRAVVLVEVEEDLRVGAGAGPVDARREVRAERNQ
jgi:hypothetical protein